MASGQSVSIMTFNNGQPQINLDAFMAIMEEVGPRPLALISINGNKRTGKSFLLNYFLRYLKNDGVGDWMSSKLTAEFHWTGGSTRDTSGINLWSKPFFTNVNGWDTAILLMDTQGSFDDQTTLQENTLIFTFSKLLSSTFIFNVWKDIEEDTLQFLQFFCNYTQIFQPESELNDQSQDLMFLIRDFFFSDFAHGYYDTQTTPRGQKSNFKVKRIDAQDSQPPEIRFVHKQIISNFRNIDVYALPDPGKEFKQNTLSSSSMIPEFQDHIKAFIELMLSPAKLNTKKIGGVEISGSDFTELVADWSRLFSNTSIPTVKTIYLSAADRQYLMAKSVAIGYFNSEMKEFLAAAANSGGVHVLALEKKRDDLAHVAMEMFHNVRKLGGVEYKRKFKEEFPKEVQELYPLYVQMNDTFLAGALVRERMNKERLQFEAELKRNTVALDQLKERNAQKMNELDRKIKAGEAQMDDMRKLIQAQEQEKLKLQNERKENDEKAQRNNLEMEVEKLKLQAEITRLRIQMSKKEKKGFWKSTFGNLLGTLGDVLVPALINKFIGFPKATGEK